MMRSWQAMTLNGFLRITMKRHGNRSLDLRRLRLTTDRPARMALAIPPGVVINSIKTEQGLHFDRVTTANRAASNAAAVVLYLHGGGYLFGSTKTHRQVLIAMAKVFESPVYGLDYRLAPEHPFPAAFEDAVQAYRWLLQQHPDANLVLAGDSAGAGLAIATAMAIRDRQWTAPKGIIGFSPYSDLAVTGASVKTNAKSCAMFTPRGVREAAALYLAGADARDPRASPLYGNLSGLPPLLLFASRHEILRDDTLRLAERASAAGVNVELVVRDRLPHVWPVFITLLPEARAAFAIVKTFARRIGVLNG